ncbi:MAG: tail fiber protein [Acidobacteria bacterium]|nr:tail fiber protein [Acidobacteriota bacterium]
MPYIGEICIFAGPKVPPPDWAVCDGSVLPIDGYDELFSLIGKTYGGDGVTNFALPNLSARVPIHSGQGNGLSDRKLGESGGQDFVSLVEDNLPAHSHNWSGNQTPPTAENTGVLAGGLTYRPDDGTLYAMLSTDTLGMTPPAPSQPHENRQPSLRVNFIICLKGTFPQGG